MPIAFDRSICCDFQETISREWIITNGQGGYAAGTVSGALTRMQHGLLVAPLPGASTPHLLLAKIDEEVVFDQRTYYLGTNEYQDGTLNPSGFVHLETFQLEEGYPLFTYRLGGIDGVLLEKRIWMASDSQTTFIQYRVLRRTDLAAADVHKTAGRESAHRAFGRPSSNAEQRALTLTLLPFSAYRPFDQPQQGSLNWHFQVSYGPDALPGKSSLPAGVAACSIRAWKDAPPYTICAVGHEDNAATFIPTNVWYWHFLRRHDQAAGKAATDDLYLPGVIRAKLWPGEDSTLTIIVSAEELSSTTQLPRPGQSNLSFTRSVEERRDILQPQRYCGEGRVTFDNGHLAPLPAGSLNAADPSIGEEEFLRLLIQATERFLIRGSTASREATSPGRGSLFLHAPEHVPGVRADCYGLSECTRDTLIALPGLTLSTQHPEIARSVLRNLARYFRQGLLPDHPPVQGPALQEEEKEDFDGADTTLWFFYALDHYLCTTGDYKLLDELYPRLSASVDWHLRGTFNTIAVDSCDGLLKANCPGKALTWMNATFNGTPITPRGGKAVEVNALWYHTLSLMQEWSHYRQAQGQATQAPAYYAELSQRCKESFNRRFWHAPADYLFDGVDGAQGEDAALRPNQLLAVALRHQVLDKEYWREVFDATTRHLLTPYGLRTLAAHETAYQGRPGALQEEQLRALHQGGSWPWLIGPYVDAMMNIERAFSTSGPVRSSKNTPEHWWNRCLELLKPFLAQFSIGILGMIGGVYDGDSPHHLSSRLSSVMGAGEFLRLHNLLAHNTFRPAEEALLAAHSGSQGRSSHPSSRPWEAEKRSF